MPRGSVEVRTSEQRDRLSSERLSVDRSCPRRLAWRWRGGVGAPSRVGLELSTLIEVESQGARPPLIGIRGSPPPTCPRSGSRHGLQDCVMARRTSQVTGARSPRLNSLAARLGFSPPRFCPARRRPPPVASTRSKTRPAHGTIAGTGPSRVRPLRCALRLSPAGALNSRRESRASTKGHPLLTIAALLKPIERRGVGLVARRRYPLRDITDLLAVQAAAVC